MIHFTTLLSQIRTLITVDVDSMNPDVAARHADSSGPFCDMTSNQAIVYNEAIRPESAHVVNAALEYARSTSAGLDDPGDLLQNAVDVLVSVLLLSKFIRYPFS